MYCINLYWIFANCIWGPFLCHGNHPALNPPKEPGVRYGHLATTDLGSGRQNCCRVTGAIGWTSEKSLAHATDVDVAQPGAYWTRRCLKNHWDHRIEQRWHLGASEVLVSGHIDQRIRVARKWWQLICSKTFWSLCSAPPKPKLLHSLHILFALVCSPISVYLCSEYRQTWNSSTCWTVPWMSPGTGHGRWHFQSFVWSDHVIDSNQ